MQAGPYRSAYDITRQALDSASGPPRHSASDAPASTSILSDLGLDGQPSSGTEPTPESSMERSGTDGSPPAHSAPDVLHPPNPNTAAKTNRSFANSDIAAVREAVAEVRTAREAESGADALCPADRAIDLLAAPPASPGYSSSSVAMPPRPAGADAPVADSPNTPSRQSMAMKSKIAPSLRGKTTC